MNDSTPRGGSVRDHRDKSTTLTEEEVRQELDALEARIDRIRQQLAGMGLESLSEVELYGAALGLAEIELRGDVALAKDEESAERLTVQLDEVTRRLDAAAEED